MEIENDNQFGILAKYYDVLNYNVSYKKVADYIENVFEIYEKKPRLVLDLACGTGSLTIELDKRGYDMTGIDLSYEMLSVAASKKRKNKTAQNNILWINQDMCSFELYGTVDAVVCCFDSLNYILDKENVAKCFASVYNYLNFGGVFIFDVNSKYKFETVYADNNFVLERKDVFCSWQNGYDKKSETCEFDMTLFVKQPDGSYKRYGEIQKERYYGEKFLKETLVQTGFEEINIFCDFDCARKNDKTDKKDKDKCGRLCFAAMKI